MNIELAQNSPSAISTEVLAVFAADASTGKAAESNPEIRLLTTDEAVQRAAQSVLTSGEFKADSCETLLLHGSSGLAAKRLLIIGLGKLSKVTPHDVRKAAGAAVRYLKPRGLRELALAAPIAEPLDAQRTVRVIAEGAVLADFDSDTYRSDRKDRSIQSVQVVLPYSADRASAESALREGIIIAESQNF